MTAGPFIYKLQSLLTSQFSIIVSMFLYVLFFQFLEKKLQKNISAVSLKLSSFFSIFHCHLLSRCVNSISHRVCFYVANFLHTHIYFVNIRKYFGVELMLIRV